MLNSYILGRFESVNRNSLEGGDIQTHCFRKRKPETFGTSRENLFHYPLSMNDVVPPLLHEQCLPLPFTIKLNEEKGGDGWFNVFSAAVQWNPVYVLNGQIKTEPLCA